MWCTPETERLPTSRQNILAGEVVSMFFIAHLPYPPIHGPGPHAHHADPVAIDRAGLSPCRRQATSGVGIPRQIDPQSPIHPSHQAHKPTSEDIDLHSRVL